MTQAWVKATESDLTAALSDKPAFWANGTLAQVHAHVGAWIDVGAIASAADVLEWGQRHLAGALAAYAELALAHIDSTRRVRLDACARTFARLLTFGGPKDTLGDTLTSREASFLRHWALSGQGLCAFFAGNTTGATEAFLAAVDGFETDGWPLDAAKAALRAVVVARALNRWDDVQAACERAQALLDGLGPHATPTRLVLLGLRGNAATEAGRKYEALRLLKDAARLSRHLPPSPATGFALFQYGQALEKLGRRAEALPWLRAALERQRVGNPLGKVATLMVLARALHATGAKVEALLVSKEILGNTALGCEPEDEKDFRAWVSEVFASWRAPCWDPSAPSACEKHGDPSACELWFDTLPGGGLEVVRRPKAFADVRPDTLTWWCLEPTSRAAHLVQSFLQEARSGSRELVVEPWVALMEAEASPDSARRARDRFAQTLEASGLFRVRKTPAGLRARLLHEGPILGGSP